MRASCGSRGVIWLSISLSPRDAASQYERLSIHDIDPLENIERELREIDETIASLKEEAEEPGEAQKYAQAMLRQLTITRADLIAIKEKWLRPA